MRHHTTTSINRFFEPRIRSFQAIDGSGEDEVSINRVDINMSGGVKCRPLHKCDIDSQLIAFP